MMCFGRPLVRSPSNFGSLGERPTHPELLDDLAVRFMEGWSVKRLLRGIVLSSAYRQTSRDDEKKSMKDPDNALLWRMNRRRLDIEEWRDTILAVSGTLERSIGGPSHDPSEPSGRRRTVYSRISRLNLNGMLRLFDYPDPNVHSGERSVTVTATQKLFVLNSPFMAAKARALAERLLELDPENAERVNGAYRLIYGRPATAEERQLALDFLAVRGDEKLSRWEQYAQLLLASNELMYKD